MTNKWIGAMGIVAVKNLLEEGFDVVGFERSGHVGGLWHFTEDEDTLSIIECEYLDLGGLTNLRFFHRRSHGFGLIVLPATTVNVSIERVGLISITD